MNDKHILTIGLEKGIETFLKEKIPTAEVIALPIEEIRNLREIPPPIPPYIIVIGRNVSTPSPIDAAHFFKTIFQEVPIYFCSEKQFEHDRDTFQRNGYTDIFTSDIDMTVLPNIILNALTQSDGARYLRPVKMIDLEAGYSLNFDTYLYLPVNNKYVHFSNQGDALTVEQIERLKKHSLSCIYIPYDQLGIFRDYTLKKIAALNNNKGTTQTLTERHERLKSAVRILLSGIFGRFSKESTSAEGDAILEECRRIVSSYVLNTNLATIHQSILSTIKDVSDPYSHASNVSTFAALFSMGTQIGKPEDMAVAALLHDLGLAGMKPEYSKLDSDPEILNKDPVYQSHVYETIEAIRRKKMVLSESLLKIISQHHEWLNGTGYPNAISGPAFTPEAQLFAIADEFEYLTRIVPGKKVYSPKEAITQIRTLWAQPNGRFNAEIVGKIEALLPI